MGLGMGAGEPVSRVLVMVVRLNVEGRTIPAMTDGTIIVAQLRLKLHAVRILMAGLALARRADKLAYGLFPLHHVALDTRNGLMPAV